MKFRHLFTLTMHLPPTLELGTRPPVSGVCSPFLAENSSVTDFAARSCPMRVPICCWFASMGVSQQDVRLILRTDDSALILMTYRGVRHASEEVNARIARGEQIPSSD